VKLRSLGLIVTLALPFATAPLAAEAQPAGKVYRIGYLGITASTTELDSFLDALRELGYVEGRNLVIERRFSEGREDQFAGLVAEVLQRNVDVIVAASTAAARAAKAATSTVPIVLAGIADPEKTGLVSSLARPGGNVTGVSNQIADIQSKLMELLKEVVPRAKRLGVLWNPDNPGSVVSWEQQKPRAAALGLTLISVEIRSPADVEPALTQVARQRPDALHLYLVLLPYRQALTSYRWTRKAIEEAFIAVGVDATLADPAQPESFARNPRVWNDGSGHGA